MPRTRKIRTRRTSRIPTYRLHKASSQAVVTIRGRDHYLGKYGSAMSLAEYDRLVAEHQATRTTGHGAARDPADLTIAELCSRYVEHAEGYYRKHGRLTSEIHTIRKAVSASPT